MLIDFRVGNYRSFKEEQTLRLDATRITEFPENITDDRATGRQLLKAVAVYGANSSGKSNLLRAMGTMKHLVFSNIRMRSNEAISYDPFLLDPGQGDEPSKYEIFFSTGRRVFRYGFEHTSKAFVAEWLFDHTEREDGVEEPLFIREAEGIEVFTTFPEGKDLEEKTRANALFLSVADQFDGPIAGEVIQWFNNFNVIDGLGHTEYRTMTFGMLEDAKARRKLTSFFKKLDLGFEEIVINKTPFDPGQLPFEVPQDLLEQMTADMEGKMMASLNSIHSVRRGNKKESVRLNVRTQESSGTNKVIDLSGPIFAILELGGVLVIDELDAKLHPHLTVAIIKLFQLPETNPQNAQLIFATHNTNILTLSRLRRDQIIFAEKDRHQSTQLYSLVNYKIDDKKVRKDRSFEKDYLLGRYGAIPAIQDMAN